MMKTTTPNNKAFSEVIESFLYGWLAQSWQWNQFPPFGSIVTVSTQKRSLIGIVHQVQTGSMDPIRYPFPYKKTQEELLKEQPQIFEFLKTTFSCLTLGYQEKGKFFYMLAPEPPTIHSFVHIMPPEQTKQFFASEQYLHLLFGCGQQINNLDELLLAVLRLQNNLGILNSEKINRFSQTFSLLTGNDYRRLKLFLGRVQTMMQ